MPPKSSRSNNINFLSVNTNSLFCNNINHFLYGDYNYITILNLLINFRVCFSQYITKKYSNSLIFKILLHTLICITAKNIQKTIIDNCFIYKYLMYEIFIYNIKYVKYRNLYSLQRLEKP